VDVHAYLRRYLDNLAIEQFPDGRVPTVIPSETSAFTGHKGGMDGQSTAAGWGDAAVLLPWTLYQYYGDESVIKHQS
jgi:alpha-L-rhamnosidase